jgi:ADP-dependent NAD(P)H-hydrate dehydratase / NAD(P)H-hydrate epimerase
MIKVVSAEQMRGIDKQTIEKIGIPGMVLMENAAKAIFCIVEKILITELSSRVAIFCGKGNNGGDGFAIGRYLWNNGVEVTVYLVGKEADLKGDARRNYDIIRKLNLDIRFLSKKADLSRILRFSPDLVIDALLGTGISGAVYGFMKDVIDLINRLPCPVIAVDVPSGLNSDSGVVDGAAVEAEVTVTLGLPKYCQVFHPAKSYVGDLYIADIGIPGSVLDSASIRVQLIEKNDIVLPPRPVDTNKYRCGKVAVLAGSKGYTGAAALTSDAALKAGAGLVILGIPEELNPIMEMKLTEVITKPYLTSSFKDPAESAISELLEWCDVLAVGPGLGRSAATQQAIIKLLRAFKKPAVIDADALFALSQSPEVLRKHNSEWILTPHHGEFMRFFSKMDKKEFQLHSVELAKEFAQKYNLTLLLKGAPSLVASADGEIFINSTGNNGLASGGTGDVLTGLVAGLWAQGLSPISAAYTANFLHGLCADDIAAEKTVYAFTASDLINGFGNTLQKHFYSQE